MPPSENDATHSPLEFGRVAVAFCQSGDIINDAHTPVARLSHPSGDEVLVRNLNGDTLCGTDVEDRFRHIGLLLSCRIQTGIDEADDTLIVLFDAYKELVVPLLQLLEERKISVKSVSLLLQDFQHDLFIVGKLPAGCGFAVVGWGIKVYEGPRNAEEGGLDDIPQGCAGKPQQGSRGCAAGSLLIVACLLFE